MNNLFSQKEKKIVKQSLDFQLNYRLHLLIAIFSIIAGFAYSFYLLGDHINPLNTLWLFNNGDPAMLFMNWLYFYQDPWHWPLTFSESLAYPTGGNVSYADIVPLWAVPLKALSFWLPDHFQYYGFLMTFNFIMQCFWGAQIGLLLSKNNLFFAVASGLLFLIAPPLTWRVHGHFSLTCHWIILAGIWTFYALKNLSVKNTKKIIFFQGILLFIVTATNPYLTLMLLSVISISCVQLWVDKRVNFYQTGWLMVGSLVILVVGWFIWGYLPTEDSSGNAGYGIYSLNLLGLFDSQDLSTFVQKLPSFQPQYEGFNYLGFGLFILLFANIFRAISQFKKWEKPKNILANFLRNYGLVLVLGLGITIVAVSNVVTLGDKVILEYPIPPIIGSIIVKFRGSGRFFWVTYYLIMVGLLISTWKLWKPQQLKVLLPLIIVIQFWDLLPLQASSVAWIKSNSTLDPLKSEVWQDLADKHDKLMVFPSNQCNPAPDREPAPYPLFEKFAVLNGLKTNSAYLARYSPETMNTHCQKLPEQFIQGQLESDTAYVLANDFLPEAIKINQDSKSSHFCHIVDGFLVCQRKDSSSVQQASLTSLIPIYTTHKVLDFRGLNNSSLPYQMRGWSAPDPQGISGTWTEGVESRLLMTIKSPSSTLIYSSSSISMKAKVSPLITENHPQQIADIVVNGKVIDRWVFNFPFTPEQSQRHTVIPSELIKENEPLAIVFRIQNPVSPKDIGYNEDPRVLSLNFETIELLSIYEKEK